MTQQLSYWLFTPKNPKPLIEKDIGIAYIYCNIIYNRQIMEADQVSMDRRMDKEEKEYIHNRILFSHKKE